MHQGKHQIDEVADAPGRIMLQATSGTVEVAQPAAVTTRSRSVLSRVLSRVSIWAPLLGAVLLIWYGAQAQGMPAANAVWAAVVVLTTQILPGALVWRAVRPRHGWLLEDVAMGFAIGSALAIGAQVVAGLTHSRWVAFSPLVMLVLFAVPVTRRRIIEAKNVAMPWWWAPVVSAIFVFAVPQLRYYWTQVPLNWPSGGRTVHIDAYLHLALSAQLATRGPTTFPWVASEDLGYHWFSHAWVAQVSVASGARLDEVLFSFMPVLMPVVIVLSTATAAVRLSGRFWAGPVAGLIAMLGGDLYVFHIDVAGMPLTPLSPSLGLAAPLMVGIVAVLVTRWRREALPGAVLVLPVLCIGAAGAKGSTLPLIVAGVALALVAMLLFDRGRVLRLLIDLVIVIACLGFAYQFVFRESGAGLHLSLTDAAAQTPGAAALGETVDTKHVAFVLVLAALAVLSRGVAVFALPFARESRRDPSSWLLIGSGMAGAGAVAVFAHPGLSQYYFARSAVPLLALGSAVGLVVLFDRLDWPQRARVAVVGLVAGPLMTSLPYIALGPLHGYGSAWAMIGVASAVVVAAALVPLAGAPKRARTAAMMVGASLTIIAAGATNTRDTMMVPPPPPLQDELPKRAATVTRDQIDAARWIRDNSSVDDLVMTNRHCTTVGKPYDCDSRRWNVAAFTERQVLLEGWTATPMSAKLGPDGRDSITVDYWDDALLRLNDDFVAKPDGDEARQLRERGVRWIFVDHTRPYAKSLQPYATLRYSNPGVDVYEFPAG